MSFLLGSRPMRYTGCDLYSLYLGRMALQGMSCPQSSASATWSVCEASCVDCVGCCVDAVATLGDSVTSADMSAEGEEEEQ